MIRTNSDYPLQPPRERGTWRAFVFALVMHVLLGFFLYHGIQWQNSTPVGAEAELWTDVPDVVTPRPPPPPPVPVAPAPPLPDEQADIALQEKKRQQQEAAREAQLAEQQRQQQLQAQQEADAKRQQQLADQAAQLAAQKAAAAKQKQQQQQADRLKQQQLAEQQKQQQLKEQQQEDEQKQAQADAQKKADAQKAAKAKAQAEAAAQAKKVDADRRARLAQMQGMAGGAGSTGEGLGKSGTGTGSGGTATSSGYNDKVQRRVQPNVIWSGPTQGLETRISVRCAPSGTILGATIARSSGNPDWDAAALRAVQHSDPMPTDTDGKAPSSFTIRMTPGG
jgi:colicin import membrane protein